MLLGSERWHSNAVTLRWKVKPIMKTVRTTTRSQMEFFAKSSTVSSVSVIPSKHLLFQLAVSARPTEGIESGLLPTCIAGDWKGQLRKDGTASMLSGKIALLPTPQGAFDAPNKGSNQKNGPKCMKEVMLAAEGLLPTPTTQEIEHSEIELTATGHRATKDKKNSHSGGLMDTIGLLPTPYASDSEGAAVKNVTRNSAGGYSKKNRQGVTFGVKVKDVVAMLPTPD